MSTRARSTGGGVLASVLLLLALSRAASLAAHPTDLRSIVRSAGASVVNIQAIRTTDPEALAKADAHREIPDFLERFFGGGEMPPVLEAESIGSGFIVSGDGLVVTNHHVVAGASEIRIRLQDRREFAARLVGSDPATDLALLRIGPDERGAPLPVATIGSSDRVAVGDWVIAIGSPFNFENTVTAGILSAKGRSFPQQQYVPFLQTDVPINRGNSGGPLLDLEGRVIGVNSQIFSENGTYMGLSFSIPIEIVTAVVAQLRAGGAVARGLLGVGIEDVTRDLADVLGLAEARGAVITTVQEGSAAAAAGLRPWDVIVAVDGRRVERFSDLPPMIGLIEPGTPASLEIVRDRRAQRISAVIGSAGPRAAASAAGATPATDGAEARPERLGLALDAVAGGLRITDVAWPAAWRAGLRPGDVIDSVNGTPTPDLVAFDRTLAAAGQGPLALLVERRRYEEATRTLCVLPAVARGATRP